MNSLIIFGAEYVWILAPLVVLWYFSRLAKEWRKEFFIFSGLVLLAAFLLGLLAKGLWLNPTPLNPSENGFPSDHTLMAGALAALMMFFNRKLSLWLWIITAVVATSRVLAGEHHAIDVVGSVVISLLSAGLVYAIMHKLWKQSGNQQVNS